MSMNIFTKKPQVKFNSKVFSLAVSCFLFSSIVLISPRKKVGVKKNIPITSKQRKNMKKVVKKFNIFLINKKKKFKNPKTKGPPRIIQSRKKNNENNFHRTFFENESGTTQWDDSLISNMSILENNQKDEFPKNSPMDDNSQKNTISPLMVQDNESLQCPKSSHKNISLLKNTTFKKKKKKKPTKKPTTQRSKGRHKGRFKKNLQQDGNDENVQNTGSQGINVPAPETVNDPLIYFNLQNMNMNTGAQGVESLKQIIQLISGNNLFYRPWPLPDAQSTPEDLEFIKIEQENYKKQILYYCENIHICYAISALKNTEYSTIIRTLVLALSDYIFRHYYYIEKDSNANNKPGKSLFLVTPPDSYVDELMTVFFFTNLNNKLPSLEKFNQYWNGLLNYEHIYTMSSIVYRFLYLVMANHYLYILANPFRNTAVDMRIDGLPLAKMSGKDANGKHVSYPINPTIYKDISSGSWKIVTNETPLPVNDLS